MFEIEELAGREILDSRGNPTVEVSCLLSGGAASQAAVPSGASTGKREALELRDGDERFGGKGTLRAVSAINEELGEQLNGLDARDQVLLDTTMVELDGTEDKSRLGANAILGVSLAVAKAAAMQCGLPFYAYLGGPNASVLPVPMLNVLNGGAHADNSVDVQEFMVVPVGFDRFGEALRAGVETYHALKAVLSKRGLATAVGDEGGFAPNLASNGDALDLLMEAIERAGYAPGEDLALAIDVAASEFSASGTGNVVNYDLDGEGKTGLSSSDLVDIYEDWIERYPLLSVEDGLAEDDHDGWKMMTDRLGAKVQIVGDDLFVTNPEILAHGIADGLANALLVKLNQIGTLTETLAAVELAKTNAYANIISHRSGETEDVSIADLAVAVRSGQIKTGAPCRSDRVAKYNRLLQIEEELEGAATYPGSAAFPRYRR